MRLPILVTLAVGLALVAAAPASALYVMTPLRISPTDSEGKVGDTLPFQVAPDPESNRSYAGATLTLRYTWDPQEGNASNQNDSAEPQMRSGTGPSVTLDSKGRANFSWTIPSDVDDRNVGLSLVDDQGDAVAFAYVRVGNAEPQMRTMNGGGLEGGGAPVDAGHDGVTTTPAAAPSSDSSAKGVPGVPLALALGVVAAAALVLARARRQA